MFVDDCSADGSADVVTELVKDAALNARVIRLTPNRGPAVARNVGWQATGAPIVAFTDDDCVPDPEWLANGVAPMVRNERIGIVQGMTEPQRDVARQPWDATRHVAEPSPFFEGCNLLVRRDALEATGGYGERLVMGFEDTWLGWAVLDAGYERDFAPTARVAHDVTFPGLRWHIKEAWRLGNVAHVAKAYPAIRQTFWRPWSFRAGHAALVGAAAGVLLTPRFRVAAALAVAGMATHLWPYRTRRPNAEWLRDRAITTLLDTVGVASIASKAARQRVFLI